MSSAQRSWGAVLALVLATAMAACSNDSGIESYCAEVADQQTPLTEAAASGPTGLLEALPSFEALRAKSPADIADAWTVVVQRVTVLSDALGDAGVDPASYDPDQPPAGVTDDDQAAIAAAATGLLTEAMRDALDRVQQQARDVCKTPLSL
ncbi:MAG: hypothetical protein WB471_11305 [Nocardioides sp.]